MADGQQKVADPVRELRPPRQASSRRLPDGSNRRRFSTRRVRAPCPGRIERRRRRAKAKRPESIVVALDPPSSTRNAVDHATLPRAATTPSSSTAAPVPGLMLNGEARRRRSERGADLDQSRGGRVRPLAGQGPGRPGRTLPIPAITAPVDRPALGAEHAAGRRPAPDLGVEQRRRAAAGSQPPAWALTSISGPSTNGEAGS